MWQQRFTPPPLSPGRPTGFSFIHSFKRERQRANPIHIPRSRHARLVVHYIYRYVSKLSMNCVFDYFINLILFDIVTVSLNIIDSFQVGLNGLFVISRFHLFFLLLFYFYLYLITNYLNNYFL